MSKVTVGCRFPNGLILTVGKVDVALNGSNSSTVIGGHGLTEVDAAAEHEGVRLTGHREDPAAHVGAQGHVGPAEDPPLPPAELVAPRRFDERASLVPEHRV